MPKKDSAAAVLTGSTGEAWKDLTPRGSYIGMVTGATYFACLIIDPGTVITGAAMGLALNAAFFSTVVFDAVGPFRVRR